MTLLSIGDLARSLMMQQNVARTKTELVTLSQTLSSGRVSDPAHAAGGNLTPLAAIEANLSRTTAWGRNARRLDVDISAMQAAIARIDGTAGDIMSDLFLAAQSRSGTMVATQAHAAHLAFDNVVSALNVRIADRSIFAGVASDAPALADAQTILSALDMVVAGALTPLDAETAVNSWFSDPAGFALLAYQGDAPVGPVEVADGTAIATGVTAAAVELRDTLAALAFAALLDRGMFEGSPQMREDVATRAASRLAAGAEGRADLAARIGLVEDRLMQAGIRRGAEKAALEIARAGLLAADPYETATRLRETEAQLQTLFTLTARLSRLTLTEYLR